MHRNIIKFFLAKYHVIDFSSRRRLINRQTLPINNLSSFLNGLKYILKGKYMHLEQFSEMDSSFRIIIEFR